MLTLGREQQLEFEFGCGEIEAHYYREGAEDLIRKLVPDDLLRPSYLDLASQRARFSEQLPLVRWSDLSRAPTALSVLLLCKYRQNASQFFYDLVSRWLVPQNRQNVELFFASDVRLPHLTDDLLTVAELVVHLKSHQEVEEARRNLKGIETELKLGVVSHYHARRILEFKGLSLDGKTAMIQEKIGSLIQSRSKDFDREIFAQMQQFLVSCPEEFKRERDYHHISRVISNLHSIHKLLEQSVETTPTKRHVIAKFFKTNLTLDQAKRQKSVLGILVGLNFLHEHEVFDKAHLLDALSEEVQGLKFVPHSYFADKGRGQATQTIYLEVERGRGDFSQEEITLLRTRLPERLKNHIAQLTHPVFMPRNEEEVLKNIRSLAGQIREAHDLPHVILSFDEQRGADLCFTVVLAHVADPTAKALGERLGDAFILERVRNLGALGNRHIKEVAVFRANLPSRLFQRPDQSIDLPKARLHLLDQIQARLGEVRDYNGGMIQRETHLLAQLKKSLGKVALDHALLLETFFYAIRPVELRTTLDVEPLKVWFSMLLQAIRGGDALFRQESGRLMVVTFSEERETVLSQLCPSHMSFALETSEGRASGYLIETEDTALQTDIMQLFQ